MNRGVPKSLKQTAGAEEDTAGDNVDQLDSHMSPASLKLIPSGVKDKSHQNRSLELRVDRHFYFS